MRLTLIKPNIGTLQHSLYVDEGRMEPLQLGVLAGMTPPDIDLKLYDDRCEMIPYDEPTDLVAITVETYTARRSYEIAAHYRARGVRVVMGGFHPTLLPEEAAEHADSIVTGDAETVWVRMLRDAERGDLQPRYHGPIGPPQPLTPTRRDVFRGKGYLPITLIQYGRGCRFPCSYCAISAFFNRRHHFRPVDEVVAEIQAQGRKLVFFVDDNIVADHQAAKELFRALIPLKIRWVSQGSLDMVEDPELMRLMAESGCLGNVIGFETINPAGLREVRKAPNLKRSADYRREIAIIKDHGMLIWAAFLLGTDADTRDGLLRQLDFALENKFTFAAFNILMPYPGTPLHAKLKAEGRLLYDGQWWLHPEYRFNYAAFVPRHMSPEELTEIAFHCRSTFNSAWQVLRRFFDPKTNMRSLHHAGIYWAYNPIFRKETFKKHGMWFGKDRSGIAPRREDVAAAERLLPV